MTTPNYAPHTIVVLKNGSSLEREVPLYCAAARLHWSPVINDHAEQYPAPHDFRPTYNETDGPGALCSACLLALGPNDIKPFHEALYA